MAPQVTRPQWVNFHQVVVTLKFDLQVEEESAVYEEVDEDEYSRIVQERQDEDWLVDDGKKPVWLC